jgi:hypothetical protein
MTGHCARRGSVCMGPMVGLITRLSRSGLRQLHHPLPRLVAPQLTVLAALRQYAYMQGAGSGCVVEHCGNSMSVRMGDMSASWHGCAQGA